MTARRRAKSRTAPAAGGPILLDWSGPEHSSRTAKPCRYCGRDTYLRDSKRAPAHKVCAEQALTVQAAEAQDAYRKDTL
jgi:hypothetical protein